MRYIVPAFVIGLALAGCAQQRVAEASKVLTARIAECKAQYPGDKDHLARVDCLLPARRAALAASGVSTDLAELYLANNAQLAAQIDRGEITLEEARVKDAQNSRDMTDATLSRRNAALAAMPPPVPAPVQFAPQQTQTTCTRFGNTVNCNTY